MGSLTTVDLRIVSQSQMEKLFCILKNTTKVLYLAPLGNHGISKVVVEVHSFYKGENVSLKLTSDFYNLLTSRRCNERC
jgi:hypothetical protein